jgi:hypothetical protein
VQLPGSLSVPKCNLGTRNRGGGSGESEDDDEDDDEGEGEGEGEGVEVVWLVRLCAAQSRGSATAGISFRSQVQLGNEGLARG